MDEHELAWAAGFFDGDGWAALVRFGRRSKRRPMAQINQAGPDGMPEVLLRFRNAVEVGHVAGPKIENGRQDLYRWVASSYGDVRTTGALIGPWLSSEKRGQFAAAVGLAVVGPPLESVAWAGGLYDAEGSTSLSIHRSHQGYKYVEAAITQGGGTSVPEELIRFSQLVGVGQVYGPYDQDGATELVYRWRIQQPDAVRQVIHVLMPWIGQVKRTQALSAIRTIDAQPTLPRGRTAWGSHKTHCVHGHEYATGRLRPYASRGKGIERRPSKQCLVCVREQARAKRDAVRKLIGDLSAADQDPDKDETTC